MKHNLKITLILLAMFVLAQLIGIFVAFQYQPETISVTNETSGEITNQTVYDLPYGLEPPEDITPKTSATSIIIALIIAVLLMFTLMKLKAETFIRIWFLVVGILGIGIALNAFLINIPNSAVIALIIAAPLGIIKVFQRNMVVHNITELLIYPGIASVFIPLLNIWTAVILLILISLWDMYAVWKSGVMQRMAQYQIEKVRVFTGFFVPYLNKKQKDMIRALKASRTNKSKKTKGKRMKVGVAILGGGDIVFPIILSGVVLNVLGLWQALLIALGATIAILYLFFYGKKGKAYPAMPYITAGCLIALGIAFLI